MGRAWNGVRSNLGGCDAVRACCRKTDSALEAVPAGQPGTRVYSAETRTEANGLLYWLPRPVRDLDVVCYYRTLTLPLHWIPQIYRRLSFHPVELWRLPPGPHAAHSCGSAKRNLFIRRFYPASLGSGYGPVQIASTRWTIDLIPCGFSSGVKVT